MKAMHWAPLALLAVAAAVENGAPPPTNTDSTGSTPRNASIFALNSLSCKQPNDAVSDWDYSPSDHIVEGPYSCLQRSGDAAPWAMLNAYRSGGIENVHWKYASDNDWSCLKNWVYYKSDGKTLMTSERIYRITYIGDSKPWCALPTYRQGGVEGKQWAWCKCSRR